MYDLLKKKSTDESQQLCIQHTICFTYTGRMTNTQMQDVIDCYKYDRTAYCVHLYLLSQHYNNGDC